MSEEIGQYSATDMATAAAQGFRDGVASVANSEIPNNQGASAAQSAPVEDRGWPDRDYWCKCCGCGEMFTGHKRQLVCRICTEESAAQSVPAGERDLFAPYRAAGGFCEARNIADDWEHRALVIDAFASGANWQRTQSAGVPEWNEAIAEAGFEALDELGFQVGQSDIGTDDLKTVFYAMLAAAPAQPAAQDQGHE